MTYPAQAPYIRFETPIFHPNISSRNGEVCIDILKESWTPALTLAVVLRAIETVLSDPNALSPLNIEASNLYKTDKIGYHSLAKYLTNEHAKKIAFPEQQADLDESTASLGSS